MTRAEIKAHARAIAIFRGWKPPPRPERLHLMRSEANEARIARNHAKRVNLTANPLNGRMR